MALTRAEREQITDSRMKIRAVAETLDQVDPHKVPDLDKILECLEDADRSFEGALQAPESRK